MTASPPASFAAPLRSPRALALLLVFAVATALAWGFAAAMPVLYDTDSYFHLAIGRATAEAGPVRELPQARFSLLRSPYPDKELLFHLLLAPFAAGAETTSGGRLALALLLGLLATALAAAAAPWLGRAGYLLPFALPVVALDLSERLLRLRPELLSLIWLLLAAAVVWRGRERWLAPLGAAYALSYTAFQLLLGLVAIWFVALGLIERRWRWRLPLYAAAGVGLGLVVHPAFPANLELWWVQNVRLFEFTAALGAGGAELRPATTAALLLQNLGFWVAALALLLARGEGDGRDERSARVVYGSAALLFAFAYLTSWRFGLYFFPFAALALAARLAARGGWPAALPLGSGRRLRLGVALAAALAVATPNAVAFARHLLDDWAPGPPREVEWAEFGRAVPAGARLAAPWGQAQAYLFYAPQASYLNFLEPLFMALPHPREFALAEALFAGREPDLALAVWRGLASDHLAFSRFQSPALARRAAGDPRLAAVYQGYNLLYRLEWPRRARFWLDWRGSAAAGLAASAAGESATAERPYPLAADPRERALEGFVDAGRLMPAGGCARFRHDWSEPLSQRRQLELAPLGPTRLDLDGALQVATAAAPGAVLGEGLLVDLDLAAGRHLLELTTCPDPVTGRSGFFLLERSPPDS